MNEHPNKTHRPRKTAEELINDDPSISEFKFTTPCESKIVPPAPQLLQPKPTNAFIPIHVKPSKPIQKEPITNDAYTTVILRPIPEKGNLVPALEEAAKKFSHKNFIREQSESKNQNQRS